LSWLGFSAHAIEKKKPFLSETGYRKLLGCWWSFSRTRHYAGYVRKGRDRGPCRPRTQRQALEDRAIGSAKELIALLATFTARLAGRTVLFNYASPALTPDRTTSLQRRSVFRWLDEQARRRTLKDEDDDDYDDDLPALAPPSPVELIARTVEPPSSGRHKFNDYLRTWPEGVWLRWAFERMGKKLPEGRRLGPYLEADKYLEQHDAKFGRKIHDRWIEWSASRDLSAHEAETLAHGWDQFVPIHNRLESRGDPEPVHGIHDVVDGVHLMSLEGDRRYKDPECILFWHDDFRVAPAFPGNIWQRPFLPWLKGAATRRDTALAAFVNNPKRVYPPTEKRQRQDGDGLTCVHISLDCPDEYGYF
jgi:hypothetical protein